jgi:hypothetical protein
MQGAPTVEARRSPALVSSTPVPSGEGRDLGDGLPCDGFRVGSPVAWLLDFAGPSARMGQAGLRDPHG